MWRRALINVALFELVLMVVIGHHWGAFYDIRGVVFNAGLVLWLGMESARVRLGHKMGVGRSRYAEENQVIRAAGRKM